MIHARVLAARDERKKLPKAKHAPQAQRHRGQNEWFHLSITRASFCIGAGEAPARPACAHTRLLRTVTGSRRGGGEITGDARRLALRARVRHNVQPRRPRAPPTRV